MKKFSLLCLLCLTMIWSPPVFARSMSSLKVYLTDGGPISFSLRPTMSFDQDNEGNLILNMGDMEISIPASQISHFVFSGEKDESGIDAPSADESDTNPVEFSYDNGIVRLASAAGSDITAALYTLSGNCAGNFRGNPVEIDTTRLPRGIYILSTGNKSLKFTVR